MTPTLSILLPELAAAADYREPLDPVAWAQKHRRVQVETGTVALDFKYAPYWKEPFEEIFNPKNSELTLQWFSRGGKTLILSTACLYYMTEEPRRIGIMLPTSGQAETFMKSTVQAGGIDQCEPAFKVLGDGSGRRDKSNTILHKIYPGGELRACGSNAPTDIRTIIAGFLWGEEIDSIQEKSETVQSEEGSAIDRFKKRGSEFEDSICCWTSFPGLAGRSRIHARLEAGDYREWWVPCLECGELWVMSRDALRYEKRDQGRRAPLATAARLECPHCAALHDDKARIKMMKQGTWKARNKFHGRRSYHANSTLWPHATKEGYLIRLAQLELDAEYAPNPTSALRVLVNTEDSLPYRPPAEENPQPNVLLSQREDYDGRVLLPEPVLMLVAAIDFGGGTSKKTQCEIKGLAPNMESYGIEYLSLEGQAEGPEMAKQIDALLAKEYEHPTLGKIGISVCAFDCGAWQTWVAAMTRGHRNRIAIKGFAHLATAGRQSKVKLKQLPGSPSINCSHIGVNEYKDIIYQRLKRQPGEGFPRGYMHFPKTGDYGEDYFDMLTAETYIYSSDGDPVFTCPTNARNEALDIGVYIEWLRDLAGVRKIFRRRLKELEEGGTTTGAPPAKKTAKRRPPKKNFVTDY